MFKESINQEKQKQNAKKKKKKITLISANEIDNLAPGQKQQQQRKSSYITEKTHTIRDFKVRNLKHIRCDKCIQQF